MIDLNLMATNIKNELANTPGIKEAFDYEPQSMNNLPAATLFYDGFTQDEQASRSKSVNWRWLIRVYVPMVTSDIKVPQTQIRTLTQDVTKQLRSNPSLSGSCLWHSITNGDVVVLTDQNTAFLMLELTLEATTEERY